MSVTIILVFGLRTILYHRKKFGVQAEFSDPDELGSCWAERQSSEFGAGESPESVDLALEDKELNRAGHRVLNCGLASYAQGKWQQIISTKTVALRLRYWRWSWVKSVGVSVQPEQKKLNISSNICSIRWNKKCHSKDNTWQYCLLYSPCPMPGSCLWGDDKIELMYNWIKVKIEHTKIF